MSADIRNTKVSQRQKKLEGKLLAGLFEISLSLDQVNVAYLSKQWQKLYWNFLNVKIPTNLRENVKSWKTLI